MSSSYKEVRVGLGFSPSAGGDGRAGGDGGGGPAVVVSAGQSQAGPVEGDHICDGQDAQGNDIGACRFQPAPTRPQPPAPADAPVPAAPAPIILTSRDVATLIVEGSGITLQPPGDTILLHMPLIAHTNPATRTLSTTVGPTRVDIEATPATYTWNWGDGTTTTTTDPGHPYPHQTVTHLYATTADNVTVTLTTTWQARYRPTGTTTWKPVDGYITTTQAAPPLSIRRLVPYLTDDAEEHHNH
ncbi:zinc transporter [Actinomyces sp. zg296]|uniref:zinc transporter n=1 Tax=Actinomyces sp. zg296 TaxID=2609289 RepID=UPI0022A6FA17|nr:zinc transporter [Actinomyces sp. zg296]